MQSWFGKEQAKWFKKHVTPEVFERFQMTIDHTALTDHCEQTGIPVESVSLYWHKSKNFSVMARPKVELLPIVEEAFDKIVERYGLEGVRPFEPIEVKEEKALKVTISDDHVGLDPLPEKSLFQYEYNATVYESSMQRVYDAIMKESRTHGTFDLLLIDNLGDEQDGWNGLTTRGGHELPQNMSNAEVFDVCVDTKIRLIESIIESKVANKIILRKVVNDNHAGDFGTIINKAVQKIINRLYSKDLVEVEILERFMEHRTYGDHCFILTHGKDAVQMKRGLPYILTDRAKNFISDYIDFYGIDSKYIHVEKGDLHQLGYARTKKFDYRNFGSFAPPSAWVQHNFGDSYSCFSIQVVPKWSNEISHTDYFLDYRRKG